MRKKTNEQFKNEVFDLVGDEYVFLDSYVNSKVKLRVKHNKCGNVYEVSPNAFLKGNRCPVCYGNAKKTDAQFKKEIYNLVGDEYIFLEPYINNYTKIKVKHNKCGNVYEVRPNRFFQGDRCVYCSKFKKTDAQFKKEVYDLVGDEYTFLDLYVNYHTKIRVKHNKCGNIYEVRPADFVGGTRCPHCVQLKLVDKLTKTDRQFKKEVFDIVNNEYTFLDHYINAQTKIRIRHNKCGNIYEVRPTDFLDHQARCPYCNSPKGETLINKILDNLSINYEYQKTFPDLKDTQPLSYDFYIPDQAILIEYQGIQHYQPVDHFGGDDKFKLQQQHDKMKADYAKANNYNLIAVPYTEDTFSKTKKYLLQHGLTK